ncbi:MAG: TRAP transporter large permease [Planctomycetes bacterium]|nr:TRAP transporter large permease [Planctomycetota bacterium]
MSPAVVATIMFGTFGVLIGLRVPVSFALGLACVPIALIDDRLTPFLLINEMWKSYNSFILLAVPFFLLAANLMNAAGITQRLVHLARASVGHLPGGLGHVNVIVSMLFAGISGSSTADAAGIGSLMIPAMKKQGYDASFSVAITACSSVMGVIIPPSIIMIVWGGLMSVSIGGLFLAGIVPGILMALLMMGTVLVYAKRRDYPVYQRASLKAFFSALRQASLALVTPAIIVGGIIAGLFTPTEASVIAVIYSALLGGLVYRSIGLKAFPKVFYESARFAAISLFCIGTASAFGWLLAYYRVPQALVDAMSGWGTDLTTTGFLIAACFLFVGMFIDAIPAIIVLGAVLLPLADKVGMHPIHFAIIGVISLAFGLVTPPYGLCLLITCSLGKVKVVHVLKDVGIILVPMMILLILVIVFPDFVLFLPRLIAPDFLGDGGSGLGKSL